MRFGMAFSGFYGVPERCSVTKALRGMSGQQNFRMKNAALACVVADFVVIFAVQAFARTICCGGKDALSRASLDLRNGEMIATFILPEFVNNVFFFLRNLLYLIADFGGSEGGLSPLLFMSKCRNFGISALFLSHLQ